MDKGRNNKLKIIIKTKDQLHNRVIIISIECTIFVTFTSLMCHMKSSLHFILFAFFLKVLIHKAGDLSHTLYYSNYKYNTDQNQYNHSVLEIYNILDP